VNVDVDAILDNLTVLQAQDFHLHDIGGRYERHRVLLTCRSSGSAYGATAVPLPGKYSLQAKVRFVNPYSGKG
jgi:hypothetical protein